ncbi:MAG TPA: Hsp20 family protein [Bacteroidaceae bacterium]|nr:Hsp20 family protein [Bacteroidaceae bacterium]
MDWSTSNFAGANSALPAVNVMENDNEYQIDVAAPGLKKHDFQVNYDNGRLVISSFFISDDIKKDQGFKTAAGQYANGKIIVKVKGKMFKNGCAKSPYH